MLPRISKGTEQRGSRGEKIGGERTAFYLLLCGVRHTWYWNFQAGIPGFKVWMDLRQRRESAGQAGGFSELLSS